MALYGGGGGARKPDPISQYLSSYGRGGSTSVKKRATTTTAPSRSRTGGGTTPKPPSRPKTTAAPKAKAAPKVSVPTLAAYLAGDLTYQQAVRRFGKTFADFLAEIARQRADISTEAQVAGRALGTQRTKDLRDILYGYAARGTLRSGGHARGRSEYETEYGERVSELERQKARGLTELSAEETKFKSEQTLAKQEAREEAARRRAEKFKLVPA